MIRRLFSALVLIGIVLAIVGYNRGWYTISPPKNENGDHVDFHVTFDKDKIKDDAKRFEDFTRNATTHVKDEVEKAASAAQSNPK